MSGLLLSLYIVLTALAHFVATLSNPLDSFYVVSHSISSVGFVSVATSEREAATIGSPHSLVFTLWASVVGVATFAIFQVSVQVR